MKKLAVAKTLAVGTLAGAMLTTTTAAWSHIRMDAPVARSTDRNEQKPNPCGGVAKGEVTEIEAGSTITVTWAETVEHGGYFVVSFDPTGDDFDGDGDGVGDHPPTSDGQGGNGDGSLVILDNIPDQVSDPDDPTVYSVEVTLPDEPCDNCTLQLMQMMAGRRLGDTGTGHMYFRCADMRLTAPAAPPEPVTPEPVTPAPEPMEPEMTMDAGAPAEPAPAVATMAPMPEPVPAEPVVAPPVAAPPVVVPQEPVAPPVTPEPEVPTAAAPIAPGVPEAPTAAGALPTTDPATILSPQTEDPSLASPSADEGTGCSIIPSGGNSLWAAALALALGGLLRRRRKS